MKKTRYELSLKIDERWGVTFVYLLSSKVVAKREISGWRLMRG
jgi:hypothetical protein